MVWKQTFIYTAIAFLYFGNESGLQYWRVVVAVTIGPSRAECTSEKNQSLGREVFFNEQKDRMHL